MCVVLLQEMVGKLVALEQVDAQVKPCSLDPPTRNLIKLIFDQDMFKSAMQNLEIGMPAQLSEPLVDTSYY